MATKLDRYRETAQIALEPWLVEAALARLPQTLSRADQHEGHSYASQGEVARMVEQKSVNQGSFASPPVGSINQIPRQHIVAIWRREYLAVVVSGTQNAREAAPGTARLIDQYRSSKSYA